MVGKRQHYVPRFLQRGFLHDSAEEKERTWLHRRDMPPRLVGIGDVGVEDWFYSRKPEDGSPTLDDAITELEDDIGPLIRALRESPVRARPDPITVAAPLVHLVFRTDHLRRQIASAISSFREQAEGLLTNPARIRDMLGIGGPTLANTVVDAIREGALALASTGIPPALSERILGAEIRENGEEMMDQLIKPLLPIISQVFTNSSSKVREVHTKIIETTPAANRWVEVLSTFEWRIDEGADFILPDAVALAREERGGLMPLLFINADDVREVLMPLSSTRLLVGRAAGFSPADPPDFNREAAACCEAFFVARRSFAPEGLNCIIGSQPAHAMKRMMAEAMVGAIAERSPAASETPVTEPRQYQQHEFSYSLHLADFGDEAAISDYSGVLQAVLGALSKDLPLHGLDGITIAIDYPGALAALDRGNPSLPPLTSTALDYGRSVAIPVPVVREGESKIHLVIDAELAQCWFSEDAETRATGLHILIKMLAGVGHAMRYPRIDPADLNADRVSLEFYGAVEKTGVGYWTARQAAFVNTSQGDAYAGLVLDSLAFAEEKIGEARAAITDDAFPALGCAVSCISSLLTHVANWAGHRDGIAHGDGGAGGDLPSRLASHGLDRWLRVFAGDLAACYPEGGALNVEMTLKLSQHVERLLWHFGIYCWPDSDGIRFEVTDRFYRHHDLAPSGLNVEIGATCGH